MKKVFIAVFILFAVSQAAATTITSENVTVDLTTSEVKIDTHVSELTASSFTYITNYDLNQVETEIDGEEVKCSIEDLQTGSEISCPTPKRQDFQVEMKFDGTSFVSGSNGLRTFQYTQSFYRPTEDYRLRVVLPRGSGLVERAEGSTVSPSSYETGSNGRRIFVEWKQSPQLGENLNFQLVFEKLSDTTNYLKILGGVALASVTMAGLYLLWRRSRREDIESIYEELSEDEIEVLEIIRDEDGSMLQKNVVNESSYSKAKISGVVSSLVEKEIVEKEKEGRSNKLVIAGIYRS